MSISPSSDSKKSGKPTPDVNKRVFYVVLGVCALLGVLFWSYSTKPEDTIPHEKGVIYYTGVRYNMHNGKWVDANGRVAPKPPGESQPMPIPKDANNTME